MLGMHKKQREGEGKKQRKRETERERVEAAVEHAFWLAVSGIQIKLTSPSPAAPTSHAAISGRGKAS